MIVFADAETTGLENPGVVSFAFIVTDDNLDVIDTFYSGTLAIPDNVSLSLSALKMHGYNALSELSEGRDPQDAFNAATDMLGKHFNKFDKETRGLFAAYNVDFDHRVLADFFKRYGLQSKTFFGSYFKGVDVCVLRHAAFRLRKHKPVSHKLGDIAALLKIIPPDDIVLHNAWGDTVLAMNIMRVLNGKESVWPTL